MRGSLSIISFYSLEVTFAAGQMSKPIRICIDRWFIWEKYFLFQYRVEIFNNFTHEKTLSKYQIVVAVIRIPTQCKQNMTMKKVNGITFVWQNFEWNAGYEWCKGKHFVQFFIQTEWKLCPPFLFKTNFPFHI